MVGKKVLYFLGADICPKVVLGKAYLVLNLPGYCLHFLSFENLGYLLICCNGLINGVGSKRGDVKG